MVMRVQGETTATPSDCVDGACVCEWLGGELHVNCTKPGTLTSLPDMGDSRSNVTELWIENQAALKTLDLKFLRTFGQLRTLTVRHSAVTLVSTDVLSASPQLQHLDLDSNKLQWIPWTLGESPHLKYLSLLGNPLQCSCSVRWLQRLLSSRQDRLTVSHGDTTTCLTSTGSPMPLSHVRLTHCDTMQVHVSQTSVELSPGDDVSLVCDSNHSDVTPSLMWETHSLTSRLHISAVDNGSLLLRVENVTLADHYVNVTCFAYSWVDYVKLSVRLHVKHAPHILSLIKKKRDDDSETCLCYDVAGWPLPQVTWLHNGVQAEKEKEQLWRDEHRLSKEGRLEGGRMLLYRVLTLEGEYTLIATNALGQDVANITVSFPALYKGPRTAALKCLPTNQSQTSCLCPGEHQTCLQCPEPLRATAAARMRR
ncbi:hypothetical protein C0Q70_21229 [Pomacea canaliculata]|uniref:Ig-like domain-containing protein n=1 Tax=Pomacea canaliculata TaxID=400727 RepID=A0A2T7NBZ1_POMCA|nr:hypothetical protein C0Q70_21229 [Pomacea canaliculata]